MWNTPGHRVSGGEDTAGVLTPQANSLILKETYMALYL